VVFLASPVVFARDPHIHRCGCFVVVSCTRLLLLLFKRILDKEHIHNEEELRRRLKQPVRLLLLLSRDCIKGYGNDSVQNGPFAEYNGSGRRVPGGSWAMGSFA
jgi:hypothetical protein